MNKCLQKKKQLLAGTAGTSSRWGDQKRNEWIENGMTLAPTEGGHEQQRHLPLPVITARCNSLGLRKILSSGQPGRGQGNMLCDSVVSIEIKSFIIKT